MEKSTLVEEIERCQAEWEATIAELGEAGWSVREPLSAGACGT